MSTTRVVNIRSTSVYDVFIGRNSLWGNPFRVGTDGERDEVIDYFRGWLAGSPETHARWVRKNIDLLRGKTLGCFCKPLPCHGDVLVEWLDAHPV